MLNLFNAWHLGEIWVGFRVERAMVMGLKDCIEHIAALNQMPAP